MNRIYECLLTGVYVGRIAFMPGTWGTLLAGVPVAYGLSYLPATLSLGLIIFLVILGIYMVDQWHPDRMTADRSDIVFDEIVGYAISMALVPTTLSYYLIAFVIFRFLDIVKPYPISYLDQRLKGGFGVMLDDVVAGIATNLIMHILDAYWGETLRVLI